MGTAVRECRATGADLQCHAYRTEISYCAGPDQDVTLTAVWTSSNPSVAAIGAPGTSPGYLKVLAFGSVQVTAAYGGHSDTTGQFFVSPEAGPQQNGSLGVTAIDAATSARIPNAFVEIQPQEGPLQSGETDTSGRYTFATFRVRVGGTIDIDVRKDGYQTAHRLLENCLSCSVTMPLARQPAGGAP